MGASTVLWGVRLDPTVAGVPVGNGLVLVAAAGDLVHSEEAIVGLDLEARTQSRNLPSLHLHKKSVEPVSVVAANDLEDANSTTLPDWEARARFPGFLVVHLKEPRLLHGQPVLEAATLHLERGIPPHRETESCEHSVLPIRLVDVVVEHVVP